MRNKIINYRNLAAGLFLFLLGLSKKVLIADTLSQVANPGFDHAGTLNFCEAWLTFSCYSVMATASAGCSTSVCPRDTLCDFNSDPYRAFREDYTNYSHQEHLSIRGPTFSLANSTREFPSIDARQRTLGWFIIRFCPEGAYGHVYGRQYFSGGFTWVL